MPLREQCLRENQCVSRIGVGRISELAGSGSGVPFDIFPDRGLRQRVQRDILPLAVLLESFGFFFTKDRDYSPHVAWQPRGDSLGE